jgi:hypothetical protein
MSKISRRHFVEGAGAGLVAAKVISPLKAQQTAGQTKPPEAALTAAVVKRTLTSIGSA